jgi:aspartate beta-hydroxylase
MHSRARLIPSLEQEKKLESGTVSRSYDVARRVVGAVYDRRIATPAVLDLDHYFPGHKMFSENWREIKEECLGVLQDVASIPQFHEVMEAQRSLSAHGNKYWRVFLLKMYGRDHHRNQSRCPFTTSLIKRDRSIQSAAFSILEGRKHIPRHTGPFRGILRYHLGLVMPNNADGSYSNRLAIDDVAYELRDGGELLFDDTYPHEAWNDSDAIRVALTLDIKRPGMSLPLRLMTNVIIGIVGGWIALKGI